MDFDVENQGKSITKRLQNACFFSHRFFIDFSSILVSFWKILGGFGSSRSESQTVPKAHLRKNWIFDGFGEGPGRLWGGFWEVFGRVWGSLGAFWGLLLAPCWLLLSVWLLFGCVLLLFAFFFCFGLLFAVFRWFLLLFLLLPMSSLVAAAVGLALTCSCRFPLLYYVFALPVPC